MGFNSFRPTFTKDQLVLVARRLGYTGKRSGIGKEVFHEYLRGKGLTDVQIREHVQIAMKAQTVTPTNGGAPALSRADVEAIVKAHVPNLPVGSAAGVDMVAVRKLIAEAVSQMTPGKIILEPQAKPVVLKERCHAMFEKVLRLTRAGVNVMLVGPAGCGKTYLAEQLARSMKRTYGTLHCTSGASESQLIGWLLPVGASGAFTYVASEFVRLYEAGNSVFLLDEMDAADPNMLLVINAALANGSIHVPQRHKDPHVPRGKNVSIIAAVNTYGTGADTMYAGRNQLDAATLDRFYIVVMTYDAALEAEIVGTDANDKLLGEWVLNLRKDVEVGKVRRVVSTRTIQKAVAARRAGIPVGEIKADILSGWTRDELAKVRAL